MTLALEQKEIDDLPITSTRIVPRAGRCFADSCSHSSPRTLSSSLPPFPSLASRQLPIFSSLLYPFFTLLMRQNNLEAGLTSEFWTTFNQLTRTSRLSST